MNKLDFSTYPGDGMPLKRSTWKFAYEGFNEAFAAFLKAFDNSEFGGNIYRLSGCEFTFSNAGNTLDVTDGWLLRVPLLGSAPAEIYKIAAQSVTKTGGQIFQFTFNESVDAVLDPLVNALGTPFNMHINSSASIVATGSGIGLVSISEDANPYLRDLLGGTWRDFSATTGSFTPDAGTITVTSIGYRYRRSGRNLDIMVQGNINVTSGSPTYVSIALPGGVTPAAANIGAAYCNGACALRIVLGVLILEFPAAISGATNYFQGQISIELQP